jgi:acetyltransferase-like isoleucine patch superfamily enzyme
MKITQIIWLFPSIIRGLYIASLIRLMGGKCGIIFVDRNFSLRVFPHSGISIGNGVSFGPNVKLYVPRSGVLKIDDRTVFTSDIFISSIEYVSIGRNVLVAEFTSIRDADHGIKRGILIRSQPMVTTPIVIGNDVWIGRGAAILRGSQIEDSAVIGANAVVKCFIPSNAIAMGVPARVINYRRALLKIGMSADC